MQTHVHNFPLCASPLSHLSSSLRAGPAFPANSTICSWPGSSVALRSKLMPPVCPVLLLLAAARCCCTLGIRPSLTPKWWPSNTVLFRCVLHTSGGLYGQSNCLHSPHRSLRWMGSASYAVACTTRMHCHHQDFPSALWFLMLEGLHMPSPYPAQQTFVSWGTCPQHMRTSCIPPSVITTCTGIFT